MSAESELSKKGGLLRQRDEEQNTEKDTYSDGLSENRFCSWAAAVAAASIMPEPFRDVKTVSSWRLLALRDSPRT